LTQSPSSPGDSLKRVTLLQSNYLPWRGYFDFMAKSDEFIVYDSCQYTVNDWRNRNQVKTATGPRWITIPIITKGRVGQRIAEAEVVDHKWVRTHLATLSDSLNKAPFGHEVVDLLRGCYERSLATRRLHEINVDFLSAVRRYLGLECRISDDSAYDVDGLADLPRSAKVAELVHRAGATRYLTGPRGLDYLDVDEFISRGVAIDVLDYSTLEPYPQLYGDFVGNVSIVDLLAYAGDGASTYLTSTVRAVESSAG
jgi:hypothetical protein